MSTIDMTERQKAEWPKLIDRARKHGAQVSEQGGFWAMDFAEESRPGRGHHLNACWNDGEHFVQILMDVYGYGSLSVAELHWVHGDGDEECECDECCTKRDEEAL